MSKPTDIPEWSTDANFPAGTDPWSGTPTTVEPSSGQKAAGWNPSQRPPAQYLNWWQNLVYQWVAWLDSIFDSDGDLYHDTKTLVISPSSGQATTGSDTSWTLSAATGNVSWTGGGTSWLVPINLPVGKRITEIRMRSTTDAGTTISMGFYVTRLGGPIDPGDDDDSGTVATSDIAGGDQDTTMTGLTTTITEGGYNYHLFFETVTGAGDTEIGSIEVDYDRLAP